MFHTSHARVQRTHRARSRAAALVLAGVLSGAVASAQPLAATAAPVSADGVVGLHKGDFGNSVRALQNALNRIGVGVKYGVDGYFGSATQASVRAFQRFHGLTVTGVVDATTARALGFNVSVAPASTSSADTSVLGLHLGSRGPGVARVQQAIIKFGWPLAHGADGVFATGTQRALMGIQEANGLFVTGAMNISTARLLGLTQTVTPAPTPAVTTTTTKPTPTTTKPTATTAKPATPAAPSQPAASGSTAAGFAAYDEHGARVIALQNALVAAGIALRGGADGVYGSGTLNGVLAFQRAKGLPGTGKVDAATAAALGLRAMDAPAPVTLAVSIQAKPVQGPCYYADSWHSPRSGGRVHLGVDIAAAEGKQLYAVSSGTISKIYTPDKYPMTGNGLRIARSDGTYFYYGHMLSFAPGINVGSAVTAGQLIGYVGQTGNAPIPHLHLEIHPAGGPAVNPYPIVKEIGAC